MATLFQSIFNKLKDRRAQLLLPAAMLVPIFVLVIYLLFETAKVSMAKVRQQFALDNAAYSQMSSASAYLNAVAMVNGPTPYRVMLYYADEGESTTLQKKDGAEGADKITIFELFYQGGGVLGLGPEHEKGINPPPKPESNDWNFKYYSGPLINEKGKRDNWEKENPKPPTDYVPLMSEKLAANYYFPAHAMAVPVITNYLETYVRTGSIYEAQHYVHKETSKNAIMFREAYFLNTDDCKKAECGRQSAAKLRSFATLNTHPFKLDKITFYASDTDGPGTAHGGAITLNLPGQDGEKMEFLPLFQFAYLDSSSRNKLRSLARGIMLKQPFKLPRNHFNINLEQKYKPYVRNKVFLSCPRSNNNCVWPNPLPKYNVTLDP